MGRKSERPLIERTWALACAVLVAGCTQTTPEAADAPSPVNDREWEVVLTVSGGFAGLSQRFVVSSPRGELKADDIRRSVSGARILAPEELRVLAELLDHVESAPPTGGASQKAQKGPGLPSCADCINYEITVRTRAVLYDAIYDTSNLGGSSDEPLIARLVELGRETLEPGSP